jgi:WD40 repeat protein
MQVLNAHRAPITALAVTSDGKTLASAAAGEAVRTWELETGKNLRLLEGGAAPLLFWDEANLVTGGLGGPLQVWDVVGGQVRRTLRGHGAEVNALIRAGQALISASDDGTIKFWELK